MFSTCVCDGLRCGRGLVLQRFRVESYTPAQLTSVKKFFKLKKPEGAETEEGWLWDIKWRE